MTSTKPYLVRALYDWIVDNNLTPYIEVNASLKNVGVPPQYVKNGVIVLNIAPLVVNKFVLGKEALSFEARFEKGVLPIYVPIYAINAIYAKENGRGMIFPPEEAEFESESGGKSESVTKSRTETSKTTSKTPAKKGKPQLKLVED